MKYLPLFIITLFILSCRNNDAQHDFPKNKFDFSIYKKYKSVTNQLGLAENTEKTIFRFWEHGPYTSYQMTQFVIDSTFSSKCSFIIFDQWQDNKGQFIENVIIDSLNIDCEQIVPINIYDDLLNIGFDTLKSQGDYPNFESNILDGIGYSIEILRNGKTKFIHFHCPAAYEDKINKKYIDILDLIEKHISVYRPNKCGK